MRTDFKSYSCSPEISLLGLDRALEDLDSSMNHLLQQEDFDLDKVIVSGVSRGGALAVAFSGKRPKLFAGVINFSGGWLGSVCRGTYKEVNKDVLSRGANYCKPALWIYGADDQYYRAKSSKECFDGFIAKGGCGAMKMLPGGHDVFLKPEAWGNHVIKYLEDII